MNRRDFLKGATLAAAVPALRAFSQETDAKAKAPASCFRTKPYAQLIDENTVAIGWITTARSTGYVTWSQDGWATQKTAWLETDGLRDANSFVHRAVIEGIDPRRRLEYKVHSRVFKAFGPYRVSYASEEEVLECSLGALLPEDGVVTWAMFNDVHENLAVYDRLVPHLDGVSAFCVFNGDIVNHVDDEGDVVNRLLSPLSRVTNEAQIRTWYLRGNHETRGGFARNMRDYLALKDSRYYGATTIGGVRFVFIDTGEDKEDSHRAYSGLVDFDGYIKRQAEWLEREVASAEWKNARARVAVRHIPWAGRLKRLSAIDAILNKSNVTLVMGAHIHSWRWYDPKGGRTYSIVTGGGPALGDPKNRGNATLVKCRLDSAGLSVKILDQTGSVAMDKLIKI